MCGSRNSTLQIKSDLTGSMPDLRSALPDDAERQLDAALSALDLAENALLDAPAEMATLTRPVVRLWSERLHVNRGDALRPDFHEVDAPVIELRFEYPGFTVSCTDAAAALLQLEPRRDPQRSHATSKPRPGRATARELRRDRARPARGLRQRARLACALPRANRRDARRALRASQPMRSRSCARSASRSRSTPDYPYQVLAEEPPWYAVVDCAETSRTGSASSSASRSKATASTYCRCCSACWKTASTSSRAASIASRPLRADPRHGSATCRSRPSV